MNDTKILETLERLKKLSCDDRYYELKKYSVKILELLSGEIYKKSIGHRDSPFDDTFHNILYERTTKLNKNFEWTNENKQKLLYVNDKFMKVFESAYKEAHSAACELENRIKNNDKFIKDYEIEIKIHPYMNDLFYDEINGSIGYILSEPLSNFPPINYSFGHSSYDNEIKRKPIYLDKSLNWNIEYFGDIFKDDYICCEIHDLLVTHVWSFNDIINICKIWTDVEVIHQHYIENI